MLKRIVCGFIAFIWLLLSTTTMEGGDESENELTEVEIGKFIVSWQLDNGGWTKDKEEIYLRYWDGAEPKAKYYQQDHVTPLGTIDNGGATVGEIMYLAKAYDHSREVSFKESINRGIDFVLEMQYPSGAFPQVYPRQDGDISNYENMATINDDATINVLDLLFRIKNREGYFNRNLIDETTRIEASDAFDRGLEFLLGAQIEVDGQLTVWAAQHNPLTYLPEAGRGFEPVALVSKESIHIIWFLESLDMEDDAKIRKSITAARNWVEEVVVRNVKYHREGVDGEYFVPEAGVNTWYRFYEIGTNEPLYGISEGNSSHDIMDLDIERRHNYGWAGSWGGKRFFSLTRHQDQDIKRRTYLK